LLLGRRARRSVGAACGPPAMSLTDLVTPSFLVAAALLVVSGSAKLVRPEQAARALQQAGLPTSRTIVRVLATAEVAVGAGSLVTGGPIWASLLAAVYSGFCVFLIRLLVRGSEAGSCGCVGSRDAPPSPVHVALDAVGAASGLIAAMAGSAGVRELVQGSPLLGGPAILGLSACAYAAYACAVYLPQAWASYRPHAEHGDGAHGGPEVFHPTTGART
jgi:hypothetical protein